MSRSKFRQLEQISNSQNYNDGYADAHSVSVAEPGSLDFSIEYDLNILRTQIKQLKGSANWFDNIDNSAGDGYTLAAIKARLDNMETFVGAADGADASPDYSSNLNYVANVSLEDAISALDAYLGNIKSGFAGTRILSGETDGYGALQRLDEGYASVQDELDRLESAIGPVVDASGNYVARSGTSYIDGNSTIDQDLRDLDAAIASVSSSTSTGYQTEDGYIQSFIGKSGDGSSMPDYSSSVIVTDGQSLEAAIGALDAYVSNNANYTLQKAYDNDANGSDAVITTNSDDGAVKIAGSEKLWVSATEGLDVDTKADFDVSQFDVDSSSGFSIDATAASNMSVAGANLTMSTTTSGDVIVSAAQTLNMDAATVEIDATAGFSIDGATASNLSTSNGNLTVSAAGSGADLIMSAADKVDVDGATIELDATGAISLGAGAANSDFTVAGAKLTLQTTGSGNVEVNAASTLDMNATGAATLDAAGITMTSSGSNDIAVVAGAQITFDDAQLASSVAMTRGSSSVSNWSAGVDEAYTSGTASFSSLGIVEAINALGDGYQSLSNEMDAFTLQRAYEQDLSADPDLQLVNGGSFEIVLGTGGSEFKVSNNAGSNTLKVADGYVLIDGYLSVTGSTVQVNSTVTDSDHLLLSPGLSSTVALKLEPSVAAGVYNANLMEMYDGYQGALVVSVDEDGDAYFAKSVEIDGVLNVDGSIDADVTSMDVDASGAITLDAGAASNFTVTNTLSFATTGSFEMDLTSGGALDMNAIGAATLDAASVALTSTGGDVSASASGDITLTAGDDIEFLDSALSAAVAMTRGGSNSVGSWSTGVGDAYGAAATFSNVGIVEAINALGDGYAAVQLEVDQIEGSLGSAVDGDGGWLGFGGAYASSIVGLATTMSDAIERLVDGYDSHKTEINNIETAAGLNADGTFSAHVGTNYLGSASTMKQVDAALDTNLKRVEDGYAAEDGFLRSFIGKSAIGSEMPDYSSSVIVTDGYSLEDAIGALDAYVSNNANYTLQKMYDNDVDGSDATITTNSDDGYVVIAGSEGLQVTATKGMLVSNLLDLNGSVDADVSTFDIDASGAFTLDSQSFSFDSTQASNASVTGADLTVSTITSGDLKLTAASNMRLKDTRSTATGAGDGSFALSTSATSLGFGGADFSSVVRSLAGVSAGQELGLINAINAIGASSSAIEKAVYVIGASDARLSNSDKTLDLDGGSGPDRGSLELSGGDGYGVDFRPGRDLEVYVNGQLMLPDASQKTDGSAATDDYFLASNDITKITFAFALAEGDVVVVKNLKPAPGEDTGGQWTLIV